MLDGSGTAVVALRRALEGTGIQLRLVYEPRNRCIASVAAGTYQVLLLASDTEAMLSQFAFPLREGIPDTRKSLGVTEVLLVRRHDSSVRWDGSKLAGTSKPVILIGGNRGTSALLSARGLAKSEAAGSVPQALEMLRRGRTDAVAIRNAEWEHARADPRVVDGIEPMDPPLGRGSIFVVFNKAFAQSHEALAQSIWNRIANIHPDGP
ncbi:MAG: hypothetical protein JO006_06525 [Paucibacter sp.]|nr:hypothetical protein [Roseateles sp.]